MLVMHQSLEQENRKYFTMQVQDATASQVPHLLVIPCLLLTLMLGPAGLLSYFLLRTLIGLIRRSDKTVKSE